MIVLISWYREFRLKCFKRNCEDSRVGYVEEFRGNSKNWLVNWLVDKQLTFRDRNPASVRSLTNYIPVNDV